VDCYLWLLNTNTILFIDSYDNSTSSELAIEINRFALSANRCDRDSDSLDTEQILSVISYPHTFRYYFTDFKRKGFFFLFNVIQVKNIKITANRKQSVMSV